MRGGVGREGGGAGEEGGGVYQAARSEGNRRGEV
jgi:hypothetical protein